MKKTTFTLLLCSILAWPALAAAASTAQDYEDMGNALFQKGLYAKAADYFSTAVQTDPNDWKAYESLGDSYMKLNEPSQALDAYQKSLQINPDNNTLKVLVENLSSSTGAAASPAPANDQTNALSQEHPSIPATAPSAPPARVDQEESMNTTPNNNAYHTAKSGGYGLNPIDRARLWSKLEVSYGYSVLTELFDSATAQNTFIANNNGTGSAMADNSGMGFRFELGFLLNPNNGLAIGVGYLQPNQYQNNLNLQNASVTYASDFETETISPYVVPLTLDYYLFLPDHDGRFFLSAGVGYYYSVVHVEDNYSYNNLYGAGYNDHFYGDLNSGAVGFQIGLGREFAINRRFGISLFARGRYAKITNYQGTVTNPDTGATANDGLATFSDGSVHATDLSNIGNSGVKNTTLDFTGFDAGFALIFYAN